ncbi:MAG TPA: hypothetical protein ENO14_02255 [Chromatiales bacterium]|nr:hypothetical protein [Chromatiales bacterium]
MRLPSPRTIPIAVAALALLAALLPALPQPQAYHQFADSRALVGLPNGLNVLSNIAFLLAGALGLVILRRRGGQNEARLAYAVFFLALIAVSAASAWYHLAPDDARLLRDRLPIAVSLAALLGAVLAEAGAARPWSLPLLTGTGLAATLWWGVGPLWGEQTLWPYLAFQAGCMAALLVMQAKLPASGTLLAALLLYGAAVAAEWLDGSIFGWSGGSVSGHTLKHFLAAGSALLVAVRLAMRTESC